jgi:hypothetical protein
LFRFSKFALQGCNNTREVKLKQNPKKFGFLFFIEDATNKKGLSQVMARHYPNSHNASG